MPILFGFLQYAIFLQNYAYVKVSVLILSFWAGTSNGQSEMRLIKINWLGNLLDESVIDPSQHSNSTHTIYFWTTGYTNTTRPLKISKFILITTCPAQHWTDHTRDDFLHHLFSITSTKQASGDCQNNSFPNGFKKKKHFSNQVILYPIYTPPPTTTKNCLPVQWWSCFCQAISEKDNKPQIQCWYCV